MLFTKRRCAAFTLSALLCGGSLFTSCHGIWRDAIFQGTEQFVLSLIDPTLLVDLLDDEPSGDEQ